MSQSDAIAAMPPSVQTAIYHFWDFAQFHSPKSCKKHGVGAFRKFLGPAKGRNVLSMADTPTMRRTREATEDWREALAQVCAHCGQCKWARRDA